MNTAKNIQVDSESKKEIVYQNDLYIFIGRDAEIRGKRFQYQRPDTLYLPRNQSPLAYSWPVKGRDILLIDTNKFPHQIYVEEIAATLFAYDAQIVRYISFDGYLTVYKKELL